MQSLIGIGIGVLAAIVGVAVYGLDTWFNYRHDSSAGPSDPSLVNRTAKTALEGRLDDALFTHSFACTACQTIVTRAGMIFVRLSKGPDVRLKQLHLPPARKRLRQQNRRANEPVELIFPRPSGL